MKITIPGALAVAGTLLASAFLLVQADRTSAPHPPASTIHLAPNPTHLTIVKNTVPTRCTEDMACWDCHTMGNHTCGDPVPAWVSCNAIDASEFPYKAGLAWAHCYENINRYHAVWQRVKNVEGRQDAWKVVGPTTTVWVTSNGWWETS